jgi:hypothetical protein
MEIRGKLCSTGKEYVMSTRQDNGLGVLEIRKLKITNRLGNDVA